MKMTTKSTSTTTPACCYRLQGNDDSIQHLGVSTTVGGLLIALWLGVLVAVEVLVQTTYKATQLV